MTKESIPEMGNWLVPTKRPGFIENRYPPPDQTASKKKMDLDLRTYSGRLGQIAEDIAIEIINEPAPDKKFRKEIFEPFNIVYSYLSQAVQDLPNHRPYHPTFQHEDLYRVYIDAFNDPTLGTAIVSLIDSIDHKFRTNLRDSYCELTNPDGLQETDKHNYGGIHPKARYLADAIIAVSKFYNDDLIQKNLRQFGKILPDVRIGSTQLDGIFLNPKIQIPTNLDTDRGFIFLGPN